MKKRILKCTVPKYGIDYVEQIMVFGKWRTKRHPLKSDSSYKTQKCMIESSLSGGFTIIK